MKKRQVIFASFLIVLLMLFPVRTNAQTALDEAVHREKLLQLIELLKIQISNLQYELSLKQDTGIADDEKTEGFTSSVDIIASYNIINTAEVSDITNKKYREYFSRVFELFPDRYDEKLSRVLVFDGEDVEFDAFVETVPPDHTKWLYAARDEIIEDADSDENAELIIHELAHIISYEEVLGVPKPAVASCGSYFLKHGCPAENSFLKKFVNTFWTNTDLERAEQFASAGDSFESAYEYYESHEDGYVTEYAATGPEEDFADSFMFYVIGERVSDGTEAKQKVDFFKQYSQLVSVRSEILKNK